jgi:hypothetical protein
MLDGLHHERGLASTILCHESYPLRIVASAERCAVVGSLNAAQEFKMPGLSRTISATAWRAYLAECPEIFEEMVRLLYRARRANQRFACQVRHKKIFLFPSAPNHP